MKRINVTYNFSTENWTHEMTDIDNDLQSMIEFSVISNSEYTDMKNHKFGYTINRGAEEIATHDYPEGNIKLEKVSRSPLFSNQFVTKPDNEYTINFYITDHADPKEYTFSFNSEMPVKPFESWIWSDIDSQWVSPKGPAPFGPYDWNEEQQEWVEENTTPPQNPGPDYEIE